MLSMTNKADETISRIRDLGDTLPLERKARLSMPRKAAFIGLAALTGIFGASAARAGLDVFKDSVGGTSADRIFNPAQGNPPEAASFAAKTTAEANANPEEAAKELLAKYNQEAPTVSLNRYIVKPGDSPAGIVEKSVTEGEIADTATYNARKMFIEEQIPHVEGQPGVLHPGDSVNLAPGTNIEGQTVAMPPEQPPEVFHEY